MTEIGFYHLTRGTPAAALPPLLHKTLELGERAVVLCGSPESLAALDEALWRVPQWLPHGTAHPALQPILLTTAPDRANGARFLFQFDGATTAPDPFARVFDLFDGRDPQALAAARARWTQAAGAGHGRIYWQQTEKGWGKGKQ